MEGRMGANAQLRAWLQELYCPTVLVAATPAADSILQSKNGLTLVDLLRPYSGVTGLNVPMRVGEASIRVQDLRISFHSVASLYQPPTEVMEQHLREMLKASALRHAKLEPSQELLQKLQSDQPPDMRLLTPWFFEYRQEFFRLLRFGDHELIDHPVACVFAIPADVASPTSHFDTLVSQLVLPPLMAQDVVYPLRDRDFPKHYLLVLDEAAGMNDKKSVENLSAIRKMYGDAHCSLLRVNSGNGDRAYMGASPDLFRAYQRPCLPGGGAGEPETRPAAPPQGIGAFLSVQDLDAVGTFVREFVARSLLPRLEERMSRLNATITTTRRGLRNRLGRLWKGSGDDKADRPYPWHSVESQMRQLGDLAFLLKQYSFAAATYRLAAQDYLSDNNNKWYAGVEEMIGLCTVLEPSDPLAASTASATLLGSQSDPMKYFMRAYEHYPKPPASAGSAGGAPGGGAGGGPNGAGGGAPGPPGAPTNAARLGRMLATRAMLLGAAVQAAAGRYLAACHGLMRAHFEEENARSALMLEQAAYALLHLRPPSSRKFAFQLVLAGIRYFTGGQKRLATHAYRQVLGLYAGQRWMLIEEQVNTVLGNSAMESGDRDRALVHYCTLLEACSSRPPQVQQAFLGQYLGALSGIRDQEALVQDSVPLVERLPLPVVNRSDVRVLYNDSACYSGQEARKVPDKSWQRLEAACCSDQGSSNWLLEGLGGKQEREHEEYNMCVAGEEIAVLVEFKNPLAVKLKVSNVRLVVQFTPEGEAGAPAATGLLAPAAAVAAAAAASGAATAAPVAAGLGPLDPGGGGDGSDDEHPLASDGVLQPQGMHLQVVPCQLTLHAGETLVEPLRVVPRAPGWLRIVGVSWLLEGCAQGRASFDVKGRRRKRPKGNRPGQLKHYPPHRRLLFQVLPAMPRLDMATDHLPTTLYSGELARVVLSVRNVGTLPLRQLSLVVGHAEAACPATDANMRRPLLDCLTDPKEVVVPCKLPRHVAAQLKGGSKGGGGGGGHSAAQLYRLWQGRELMPGEALEWPLWLHPRGAGVLRLQLVWYGEPAAPRQGMRSRTLRVCLPIQVVPLVSVKPTLLRPAAAVLPELAAAQLASHMLRLDVEHSSKDADAVSLHQVAAVTPSALPGTATPTGTHRGAHTGTSPAPTPLASTPAAPAPLPTWRLARVANQAAAEAGVLGTLPDGPDGAAAQAGPARALPLSTKLESGESTELFLQLIAPQGGAGAAAGAGAGAGDTPRAAAAAAAASAADALGQAADALQQLSLAAAEALAGQASPSAHGPLHGLDLLSPVGILSHFYRHRPAAGGHGYGMGGAAAATSGSTGSLPLLESDSMRGRGAPPPPQGRGALPGGTVGPSYARSMSLPANIVNAATAPPGLGSAAAAGGGAGAALPAAGGSQGTAGAQGRAALPLADPPLDLLLLWQLPTAPHHHHAHAHGPRLGLARPWDPKAGRDLWSAIKAQTPPIRMLLTRPPGTGAGGAMRHDFRRSMLAIVPLTLTIRNNTNAEAKLQVEVGSSSWPSQEPSHAWQVSTATVQGGQPPVGSGPMPSAPGQGPPQLMPPPPPMSMSMSASVGPGGYRQEIDGMGGGYSGYGAYGAQSYGGPTGQPPPPVMSQSMMAITYQAGLPPNADFTWVGPTYLNVPCLAPGATLELPLSVCVYRPGSYSVQNYCCTYIIGGLVEKQWGEALHFRVEGTS